MNVELHSSHLNGRSESPPPPATAGLDVPLPVLTVRPISKPGSVLMVSEPVDDDTVDTVACSDMELGCGAPRVVIGNMMLVPERRIK